MMPPVKIEQFERTIYLTCQCGCRFSPPKAIPSKVYAGFVCPVSRYVCPGCKRIVTTMDRDDGRIGKPAITAGFDWRSARV